jgi:hypothetical protein
MPGGPPSTNFDFAAELARIEAELARADRESWKLTPLWVPAVVLTLAAVTFMGLGASVFAAGMWAASHSG